MGSIALRSLDYWLIRYRRTWRGSAASTVLTPVLFLAAMGVGLGSLVDRSGSAGNLGGVSYLAFLAPGVLAATAMQTAAGEATYPVLTGTRWVRTYHAMIATPLSAAEVFTGHLVWMVVRVAMTCLAFVAAMAAFGTLHSAWAPLALPAAILTGLAHLTPVAAFSARLRNDAGLAALFRFGIMPMFLFSGAFFPVSQLPALLRAVAYGTPVWHGVALCRGFTLGQGLTVGSALLHAGYLTGWSAVGFVLARRSYQRALVR
ncbi:MAG: ABC transporter permease [Actinobacteria bacterium]|nr:ABC transporter permease [Actinomycetota bacterium]